VARQGEKRDNSRPGSRRDLFSIGAVLALLVAVGFLPPDTSLRDVEARKTLRACVPPSYPPLVTGDPALPGLDIELLRAVAQRMGLSLSVHENTAMGRDFNPRNWALNRAQCEVVAGGVVDSTQTRSFLETGPTYTATGWALVSPAPLADLNGKTVGALALISGLDRIGLSGWLRAEGATVRVVTSAEALAAGIADGTFDAGVTEALLASRIADDNGWDVEWTPETLARYNFVFGLWKGDITLKRAIVAAFDGMRSSGELTTILERYDAAPIN
jgi:ABC-type amino acid transport substrate-binding protein